MLRDLRKSLASHTTPVVPPEIFPWTRWIKEPKFFEKKIPDLNSSQYDTSVIILEILEEITEHFDCVISCSKELFSYEEKFLDNPKTSRIFFGFGTTKSSKYPDGIFPQTQIQYSFICRNENGEITFEQTSGSKTIKDKISVSSSPIEAKLYLPEIKLILYESKTEVSQKFNLGIKNLSGSTINFEFIYSPPTNNLLLVDNNAEVKIKTYSYKFNPTIIIDHISAQLPEIYCYDLLSEVKYSDEILFLTFTVSEWNFSSETEVQNLILLNKTTYNSKTYFLKNIHPESTAIILKHDFAFEKAKTSSIQLSSEKPKINLFYEDNDSGSIEDFSEKNKDFSFFENILSPYSYESSASISVNIPSQIHEEGIEFLSQNKFAFLNDSYGLGKYLQVTKALKEVSKKNKFRSLLIITEKEEIGDYDNNSECKITSGWISYICNEFPKIPINVIAGDIQNRSHLWMKNESINIISYSDLFEDVNTGIIDKELFLKFDFVVLDDCDHILNKKKDFEQIHKNLNPKYIWLLSGLNPELCKNEIYTIFAKDIIRSKSKNNFLRRTRKELLNSDLKSTALNYENLWVDLDEIQNSEYDETLVQSTNGLIELLRTGNPYRFEANVFSLIHQLKKISNCSSYGRKSGKLDLIVKQLSRFSKNGEQCIVLTQYEKQGVDIIEKSLTNNEILFEKLTSGMPVNQINEIIKNFRGDKKCTALLCNFKRNLKRIDFPEVPYIIHFDKWWNPIASWQIEENFISKSNDTTSSKTIYSYCTKNTLEEEIENLLSSKGLVNKNLLKNLSAQTFNELIEEDDWLNILNEHVASRNQTIKEIEFSKPVKRKIRSNKTSDEIIKKFITLSLKQKMDLIEKLLGLLNFHQKEVLIEDEKISIRTSIRESESETKTAAFLFINKPDISDIIDQEISALIKKEHDLVFVFLLSFGLNNSNKIITCDHSLIDPPTLAKLLHLFRLL